MDLEGQKVERVVNLDMGGRLLCLARLSGILSKNLLLELKSFSSFCWSVRAELNSV